ncbi:putative mitochondrial protein AtMg00240 [Tasmannia lanceolata]|uniref:putative mitochondrial protein AtMg00240 n=1 Tax=Tasmannia lanceolata TaxID=3420 RepID=UPI004063645E
MDPNVKLSPDQGELMENPGRYRRLVGKLIYLTVTRPDISYAVGVSNQFMNTPWSSHQSAVTQIVRYLKKAPGKGLIFRKQKHMRIEGYSDADWAGSLADRRSATGYCTFVGGNRCLGRARNRMSYQDQVLKQSIGPWPRQGVS